VVGTDRDRKIGALRALLAQANEKGLDYVGAAFIALDDVARADFIDVLDRLATPNGLFKATRLADVRWCVPNGDCASKASSSQQNSSARNGEGFGIAV
jgi:hypothetical protein